MHVEYCRQKIYRYLKSYFTRIRPRSPSSPHIHACMWRPTAGLIHMRPYPRKEEKIEEWNFSPLHPHADTFLLPFFRAAWLTPKFEKEKKGTKKRKVLFSLLFEVSCSLWEFERLLIDFSPSLQPGSLPFPPSFGFAWKNEIWHLWGREGGLAVVD